MASEWVMYLAIISLGVLTIAGVTLTFNSINNNTLINTIEVELNDVMAIISEELRNVIDIGLATEPTTYVRIDRILDLPYKINGHQYQISFKVIFPLYNNWVLEGFDLTDATIGSLIYESTIPWSFVTLNNYAGTGLPIIQSSIGQHHILFERAEGSSIFRIFIW